MDRDIDWIRHQLDSLAMGRTGGGLNATDATQYRKLCGLETTLIERDGCDSTSCRIHDHGACRKGPIPMCACWCHWDRVVPFEVAVAG